MTKLLYHKVSTRYGSSERAYNGCATTGCPGEQARGYTTCIRHLSDADAQNYANSLERGEGVLVFSELEVDADFVKAWIERITTVVNGVATVRVPVEMEAIRMVDGLEFQNVKFEYTVTLTSAQLYSLRIFRSEFNHFGLVLTSAKVKNEFTLSECDFSKLDLVSCEADRFFLNKSMITEQFDARALTVSTWSTIRETTISPVAEFRDAVLANNESSANINCTFGSRANFTNCSFGSDTKFGRNGDVEPSSFGDEAVFDSAVFGSETFGSLTMPECLFEGSASFRGTTAYGLASFSEATFKRPVHIDKLKHRPRRGAGRADGRQGPRRSGLRRPAGWRAKELQLAGACFPPRCCKVPRRRRHVPYHHTARSTPHGSQSRRQRSGQREGRAADVGTCEGFNDSRHLCRPVRRRPGRSCGPPQRRHSSYCGRTADGGSSLVG